jgi:ribosomal protein S1
LSELSERNVANPAELVRLWQVVKAKLIALDPSQRKIGLSVKALNASVSPEWDKARAPRKAKSLDDVESETPAEAPKKAAKVVEEAAE